LSIEAITRSQCRDCRDLFLKLPVRALRYSNKYSPQELVCMDKVPISPKTVNKNIQFISALFRWAVNEELIENNPARNLSVTIKNKASLERKAYDLKKLRELFDQLPSSEKSPEEYWLPLMGYYSGMRVEELCQLRTKDIGLLNGIHCLFVSPEAGPLKTINAERVVPIHSELIRLGLINYTDTVGTSDETKRLWQNLMPDKYGKFSSAYTKRFGRFKRKSGVIDPQLTFHSLRHTFVNELKQQGEAEFVIAQLVGHSNSSITMEGMGKIMMLKCCHRQWNNFKSLR
jgi:integrase